MYRYSKKTLAVNFTSAGLLIFLGFFLTREIWYAAVVGLMAVLVLKDAIKEMFSTFEVTGDRLIVRFRDKVIKEIKYRDMKYLTITRRNKHWVVIADDQGILFTIKPKIENYQSMVADIIKYNQSNRKLEVHDYVKKTYKR